MASGLFALLDDIAGIAKMAAASLDDVSAAAGKAGAKAVGVVVDDTAVTPGYAMGFSPDRELPIVWKIAKGSLRNKFLYLLPAALLLSAFAPWAVTPLLMCGGAYLCFEATEKILEVVLPHSAHATAAPAADETALETRKVAGAIRTDLILSAEIMAIALASVADKPLGIQAGALVMVGLSLTVAVYGVVAFIVKMDDIGLHLARRPVSWVRAFGRGLVHAMPPAMAVLSVVGTAAMLWVGGGILVHGLEHFHVDSVPALVESAADFGARVPLVGVATQWLGFAAGSALVGLIVGIAAVLMWKLARRLAL